VAQADRVSALRRRAERAQAALERNEARLTELVAERTQELSLARDRAEAANRSKTRFLANMSHDLRTPLHAVLGGVDLLRRSPRLGRDEQAHCGLIARGGRHLLRLIDDLLDIARIEHDRLRPQLAALDLSAMLTDLAAVTRRQAEAKGLAFEVRLGDDPVQAPLPERAEPPPPTELEAARELAERGDWAMLRDWRQELADAFPECADFAEQVGHLLDAIDADGEAKAARAALWRLLAA
jgi:signal transduction histidine kinase